MDKRHLGEEADAVFSIERELHDLVALLGAETVPYALCGALALAVYGTPRATLDIDLLALAGSSEEILRCARSLGFRLPSAPMNFSGGDVRIHRVSKAFAGDEDVLMLDVLSLATAIEREITTTTADWNGLRLQVVTREGMIRLKRLRGSAQDLADIANLT